MFWTSHIEVFTGDPEIAYYVWHSSPGLHCNWLNPSTRLSWLNSNDKTWLKLTDCGVWNVWYQSEPLHDTLIWDYLNCIRNINWDVETGLTPVPSGVVRLNHNVNYTGARLPITTRQGRKVMGRLSTFDCFIGGQTYKPTNQQPNCGFCLLASITLHIPRLD